jgi:hypothetical protein
MTPRELELNTWKETCAEFIGKAQTVPELEATGKEIANTAGMIVASDADLKPIREQFKRKMEKLKQG